MNIIKKEKESCSPILIRTTRGILSEEIQKDGEQSHDTFPSHRNVCS